MHLGRSNLQAVAGKSMMDKTIIILYDRYSQSSESRSIVAPPNPTDPLMSRSHDTVIKTRRLGMLLSNNSSIEGRTECPRGTRRQTYRILCNQIRAVDQ